MGKFVSALIHFSSVAQSCPTLCDPMNPSTPGLPVHHKLYTTINVWYFQLYFEQAVIPTVFLVD